MLFPTVDFGIFFVAVFAAAWLLRGRDALRRAFLTAASYFFYGYWNWSFTALLFLCTAANYLFGLALGALEKAWARKLVVAAGAAANLSALGYFKYATFISESGNAIFRLFGLDLALPVVQVVLPVGISFFVFQAMSYVIDVYRKDIPAERSLLDLLLYVSFFPQLVAGPIVRAKDFIPQLKSPPDIEAVPAGRCLLLVSGGLFKKLVMANYLSTLWVDKVFLAPMDYAPLEVLLGVYAYAVVIYCDFSAYSDIAIGTAGLLGYGFPANFDQPYRSLSLREFWKRWHISLSTWLRDYLYIPMGGNRKGRLATYRNLLVTMLLGGLWHGAALKFLVWGGLHGTGLAVERMIARRREASERKRSSNPAIPLLKWILTFNLVCLGWIFFRAQDFSQAFEVMAAIVPRQSQLGILTPFLLGLLALGIGLQFLPPRLMEGAYKAFSRIPALGQGLAMGAFLLGLSAMSSGGVAPFIYFQF